MFMFNTDSEYPVSANEVLSPPMRFQRGTLSAMQKFKNSKPWFGTQNERAQKFQLLINDLSDVYSIHAPLLDITAVDDQECSDGSFFVPMMNVIYLKGRLSVITLLHEFAHGLGKGEYDACRWSLNLFRRVFPRQWNKLEFEGHLARRRTNRT